MMHRAQPCRTERVLLAAIAPYEEATMLSGRRSLRRPRRGAALVEFAMVVPVVFVFLFVMIELSRYVMVQQALTSAAQQGCRKAMLATTQSNRAVEAAVRDYLGGSLGAMADSGAVQVTVTPETLSEISSGSDVTVRVQVSTADVSWVRGTPFGHTSDVMLAGQSTLVRE